MAEGAGLLSTIKSWFTKSQEGSYRGPFYGEGELGNQFMLGHLDDGWQRNLTIPTTTARHVAPVYSCVMLNARAVSQCDPRHMVAEKTGGFAPSTTSPASRILRVPNGYETWTQLIYNTVAEVLFEGESLWIATRDDRNVVNSVHRAPRKSWTVHVDDETKEVFYGISQSDSLFVPREFDYLIPARDVCHFRQHCPRHPLVGESPVKAAMMAIGINVALNNSQMAFFTNMSRASGIISTDQQLNKEQLERLKSAWESAAAGLAQGRVPVLVNGLKFQPMSIPQNDQQLIEQQKLSIADIARVFGVPVALITDAVGPQGATETLVSHWLSIGLGSIIESIERSLDRLFNLPATEYIDLDPTPLLRVDFAARIDGLAKAVQGGIFAPNEARVREGYGKVDGGDTVFLQQQMVPVDLLLELHAADVENKKNPPAPPMAAPDPAAGNDPAAADTPPPPPPPQAANDKRFRAGAVRRRISAAIKEKAEAE